MRGDFHDGLTAQRHDVAVEFGVDALVLRSLDGAVLAAWPLNQIRRVDDIDGVLRLTDALGEARLMLADRLAIAAVTLRAPHIAPAKPTASRRLVVAAALVAGFVSIATGAWLYLPHLIDAAVMATPRSWEEPIGRMAMMELVGDHEVCVDREGRAALDVMIDRLTRDDDADTPFQVIVVADRRINAFAAPDGWIVIYRGLIADANSAEEVAGVLAHEIGHAAERHILRMIGRAIGLRFIATLAGVGGALDYGAIFVQQSFSRDFERDADAHAVRRLTEAGITTSGFASFFERKREAAKTPGRGTLDEAVLAYLSTHPSDDERAATISRLRHNGGPVLSERQWARLRAICGQTRPIAELYPQFSRKASAREP